MIGLAEAEKRSLVVLSHVRWAVQGFSNIEKYSSLKKMAVTQSHALKKINMAIVLHMAFRPHMDTIMFIAIHVPQMAHTSCAASPAIMKPVAFATMAEGNQKAK